MQKIFNFLSKHLAFYVLVITVVFFGFTTDGFLTMGNFENVISNTIYMGILSMGMFSVMLVKGIDISMGAIVYFSGIILSEMLSAGHSLILASIATILVGTLLGSINGFFITVIGVTPFLATLFNMIIFRGAGKWITKSKGSDYPDAVVSLSSLKIFGVIPFWAIMITILFLLLYIFFNKTITGRLFYTVGFSEEIAKKSGINTKLVTFRAYCLAGALAGMGSIVLASQIGKHYAGVGELHELEAITAAVLGGVSLFGGIGTLGGALLGALTLQTINTGLVFLKIDLYVQPMITALILFFAITISSSDKFKDNSIKIK